MKQPDFFRLFSEKMQGATPPPDFSGDDWQALQGRLDAHDQRRARVLPFGWLAGLTGLLLLSNLAWFLLWQKTDDEVAAIRTELSQSTDDEVVLHDTVYKQLVVYQYDTIYRAIVVKRVEQSFLAQMAASQHAGGTSPANRNTKTNGNGTAEVKSLSQSNDQQMSRVGEGTATDGQNLPNQAGVLVENNADRTALENLQALRIQPFAMHMHRPILPPTDDVILTAKQEPTAFPLIPQSFTLGIGAGGLTPISKNLASSSGILASISGEIGFSKQLTMNIDGSLGALKYKGYVEDPSLGLPAFQSPGDDYDLKYFETHDDSKRVLQLGIGMRWYFRPDSKLNPWLGAGWTTQWNPGYELELEYTYLPTGMETSDEIEVPALQKPLSYAGFNFGLRYRLAERWYLQAGGFYDFKASKQQGIPRWWGWRLGAAHRF